MPENRELMVHVRRREALLARSAENRRQLCEDAAALQPVVAWVDLGVTVARKARGYWETLGPILTAWRAMRPASGGWMGRWARGVSVARSLLDLWRTYRDGTRGAG